MPRLLSVCTTFSHPTASRDFLACLITITNLMPQPPSKIPYICFLTLRATPKFPLHPPPPERETHLYRLLQCPAPLVVPGMLYSDTRYRKIVLEFWCSRFRLLIFHLLHYLILLHSLPVDRFTFVSALNLRLASPLAPLLLYIFIHHHHAYTTHPFAYMSYNTNITSFYPFSLYAA